MPSHDTGPSKNKNQLFRAWLIKLLEEKSNNPESPSEDVNVNSTLIPNSVPSSEKEKRTIKLDFLLGL